MSIYFYQHSDIQWTFDNRDPYVLLETVPYKRSETVDPFPCYSHNESLVRAEIEYVTKTTPVARPPSWHIMPFECPSRTNGYAAYNKYSSEDANPYIALHGKRIPLMPAMTRYLVAHEYGHTVHYSLKTALGLDEDDKTFEEDYAKMRGTECNRKYGGLKWHTNIKEIIANDIRICLFGREAEFWPHPVAHPNSNQIVKDYWMEMKGKLLTSPAKGIS